MQVAGWTAAAMALVVIVAHVEYQTKVFTWLGAVALHIWGKAWCAMMRHTGDPVYTHKGRRYR